MVFIDLTGQRFGHYLVVARLPNDENDNAIWKCICDCGNERKVKGIDLRAGRRKSCGCSRKGINKSHGLSGHRFYGTWVSMKQRCCTPSRDCFSYYGGRGISVCEEWRDDPAAFCEWCDNQKVPKRYTLDRIDNDGNYCPENCHFVSMKEQSRNTRQNVWIEHNGETLCYHDFIEKYGVVKNRTAYGRVYKGWNYKDAALTPLLRG